MNKVLKIFILLLFLNSLIAYSQQDKIIELINSANQKANEGKIESALADLNSAIKIDNKSIDAYIARGLFYTIKLYNNKLAIKDFDSALKLKPNNGLIYIYKARLYLEMKEYSNAQFNFRKALKLKPAKGYKEFEDEYLIENLNYSLARTNLKAYELIENSNLLIKSKYYNKAIELLDSAILIDSSNYLAYANKGMINQLLASNDKAIYFYIKTLELNEYSDIASFGLAEIYNLQSKYELAINLYSKVLIYKPKSSIAMRELGLSYYKSGNNEKAHKLWNESLKLKDKRVANYIKKYPK